MVTALQRDILSAVARSIQDGVKVLQVDKIIDDVAARHDAVTRRHITERVVQVARTMGAVVIWSAD